MEENRKDRRKTGLLLSILGVISLVLITAGVTYAFFSYAKEGQTENVITTGTIQFAYDEVDGAGAGILLQDALPISDAAGMGLDGTVGSRESFNFKVTSLTPSSAKIPYVVTVTKKDGSTIADDQVKLYLVATGSETGNGTTVDSNVVRTFSQLPLLSDTSINTANISYTTLFSAIAAQPAHAGEKVLFAGLVPENKNNTGTNTPYETNFVLRMWLSGDQAAAATADYSPYEFMKTTVATNANGAAINAENEIRSGNFITSTAYYALPQTAGCSDGVSADATACANNNATWSDHGRSEYERIAYVNTTAKTVYTLSQAIAAGTATDDGQGNYTFANVANFTATEQYYQINGQTYTVKVNVYAEGAKVTN